MVPQPTFRVPVRPQWSAATVAQVVPIEDDAPWNASRELWIAAFTERMAELRPHADEAALRLLAADLWVDVGRHDPLISAEMEHEASLGD